MSTGPASSHGLLQWSGGADLRDVHRLGHAEEDHDALSAAASRQRFARVFVAAVDVLPVVHDPDVARRRDGKVRLHLQPAPHVAVRRRNLLAGLEAGWTVLCAHAAKLRDRAVGHREIGNPNVVVAIYDRSPRTGEAAAREWRAEILRAIRAQQGDASVPALLLGHAGGRESCAEIVEFFGFVSRRRKAGSLHGLSKIRSSIAFL